jgi:hypothetical protein
MRTNRLLNQAAWSLSLLLGQASVLLGLMLAMGWMLAFAVVLPKANGWSAAPGSMLPIEPPLIGLALGAAALWVARWSNEPIARYGVAGMIFNAIPLGLVLLLAVVRMCMA